VVSPPALRYVGDDGEAYDVWDLVEGERETPGNVAAPARLFVRLRDRTAYTTPTNPRVPAHTPDAQRLRFHHSLARELGPVQRQGEDAAAYAARRDADLAAYRATQRAEQHGLWAETPPAAARPAVPTRDATRASEAAAVHATPAV
jgi:hypothetical protein